MAHAEASDSLDRLPRAEPVRAASACVVCSRCGDALVCAPGQIRRCGCGRVQLEHPAHGGLGPVVTRWPARRPRGARRG